MITLGSIEAPPQTPWDTVEPFVEVCSAWSTEEALPQPKAEERVVGGGGAFTIPLICIGIGLIAMCLLIPAADENRRLAYERDRLQADLDQLHRQVQTNDAFLKKVANDPTLAERLARRQMKMVPQGTEVLELKSQKPAVAEMSPFLLVTLPPPAPMQPYRPIGGFLADACRNPKTQLYLIGGSLMMIATGLVLSRSEPPGDADNDDDVDEHPWAVDAQPEAAAE
jgi:hypothetical protein